MASARLTVAPLVIETWHVGVVRHRQDDTADRAAEPALTLTGAKGECPDPGYAARDNVRVLSARLGALVSIASATARAGASRSCAS